MKNMDQNTKVFKMWERLNRLPLPTYLRFQKFIERNHKGMWWRGITMYNNGTEFIIEPNFE